MTKPSVLRPFFAAAAAAALLGAAALALDSCNGGLFTPFAKAFLQVMPLRRTYHIDESFDKEADLKVYLEEIGDIPLEDVTIKVDSTEVLTRYCVLDRIGEIYVDVAYADMSARYAIWVREQGEDDDDETGGIIINIPW